MCQRFIHIRTPSLSDGSYYAEYHPFDNIAHNKRHSEHYSRIEKSNECLVIFQTEYTQNPAYYFHCKRSYLIGRADRLVADKTSYVIARRTG